MSQRGFGQAPYPAEDGMERRSGSNGRPLDRASAPRAFGSRRQQHHPAWDEDAIDPREIDRYLEDRARLADSPRPARDLEDPAEPGAAQPGTRWSSPSRRRRLGHPQTPERYPDENRYPPPYSAPDPEPAVSDWRTGPDPFADPAGRHGDAFDDPYHYDEAVDLEYLAPAPATRRSRRVARPRPTIVMPQVRMPAKVADADIARDPVAVGLLGAGIVLTLVSALVAFSRIGDLPSIIELRYDAYGTPSRWGPPKSLWQIPLLVAMVTVINLVLAASLSRRDRFASRFLLAAALVIGLLAWVSLTRFLW